MSVTSVASKFVSFLKTAGADIEKGIEKAAPFFDLGSKVAASIGGPGAGIIFSLVSGTVLNVEQKFAAIGKQSGTGAQKLQDAVSILGPALTQLFQSAGWNNEAAAIQGYISNVVDWMNSFPVSPAPAAPAA